MKYWAFIIASDLTVTRVWMDSDMAVKILQEHKDVTIIKYCDQQAVLIDGQIFWKEIKEVHEYKR